MDKNKILDYQLVKKKIIRISLQIIEANSIDNEIIIAGIENNGYVIAKKICDEIKKISDKKKMYIINNGRPYKRMEL